MNTRIQTSVVSNRDASRTIPAKRWHRRAPIFDHKRLMRLVNDEFKDVLYHPSEEQSTFCPIRFGSDLESPWLLKFKAYNFDPRLPTFPQCQSIDGYSRDFVREFYDFCWNHESFREALYVKGTGKGAPGLRLWPIDRGICWVLQVSPEPSPDESPVKLFVGSMTDPSAYNGKGTSGVMTKLHDLTHSMKGEGDNWRLEDGRNIDIEIRNLADRFRNFELRLSNTVTDVNGTIERLKIESPDNVERMTSLPDALFKPSRRMTIKVLRHYCQLLSFNECNRIYIDAFDAWQESLSRDRNFTSVDPDPASADGSMLSACPSAFQSPSPG